MGPPRIFTAIPFFAHYSLARRVFKAFADWPTEHA
jgi:hypothetical protein